jgi:hypothetical protein
MLFGLRSVVPTRVGTELSMSAAPAAAVDFSAAHALALFPELGTEHALALPRMTEARGVALAAHWIDACPLKFSAQDGGLLVALRVLGP